MTAHWDRLGIAPTADRAAIKRAYAARLKHTRPDDDAEGYQRLREAYDWALGYARWCQENPEAAPEPEHDRAPAPVEAPRDWRSADPLAAWVGVSVMGKAAGLPRSFVSVAADPRPRETPPRWWRRRQVPLHEGGQEEVVGEAPPSADALIAELQALAEEHAGTVPAECWPQLAARLDALPFAEQSAIEVALARFVFDHPALPPALVLRLAARFGWGQDFRLEQQIGEAAALQLYERLAQAREAAPGITPAAAGARARERYEHLLHTARCHDTGRMARFWLRVLLSPLSLFGDARAQAAQRVLEEDEIDWRRVKRLIDGGFAAVLLALALGLAALQGPDSLLAAAPAWALPALLLAGGVAGLMLVERLPAPLVARVHRRWRGRRIGRWLGAARAGRRLYWGVLGAIGALIPAAFLAAEWCVGAGLVGLPAELALATTVAVMLSVLLGLVWPLGEAWESLVLPALLIVAAFAAQAQEVPFAWTIGLPIGCMWIVAASVIAMRAPALAEAVLLAPFSLLRPRSAWGWVAFVIFIKGVAAFYAALFLVSAPLNLFAYARLYGGPRAYLALACAAALWLSGALPANGWTAILWLQLALLGFSRLGRFAGWLLARPALALPR